METAVSVQELRERVAALDPSGLGAREAEDLLVEVVGLAHAAWALAGRVTRRVGETQAFRRCGDRSEAHHLGRVAGVGLGVANQAVAVTAAVEALTATRAALAAGGLSMRQAEAIAGAAAVDRRAEARLLRLAEVRGITQLEEECARVRAAATPDEEAERHRRARDERGCWQRTNRDGSAEIRFRSSLDQVTEAWKIISAFRDRLVRDPADRGVGGDRPSFDQLAADGFMDLCRAAAVASGHATAEPTLPLEGLTEPRPVPAPKKVIIRVDLDALLRGYPSAGEVCEIPGIGPLPVQAVRDLIRTDNPILAGIVTRGTDVIGVAHLGRAPNAVQQTAMEWLEPRCKAEGCDRTIALERDHRAPWADTKITVLDLLDWLCTHHHQLKTHHHWALVPGHGTRAFVPPQHPDHPGDPTRAGPDT
jgi:hypothetical protein